MVRRGLIFIDAQRVVNDYPNEAVPLTWFNTNTELVARDLMSRMSISNFEVFVTTDANRYKKSDYLAALGRLIAGAQEGDVLVNIFCGAYGPRTTDTSGDETDGYDESIPFTYGEALTDDELRSVLSTIPAKVQYYHFHDSQYGGTVIDCPYHTRGYLDATGSTYGVDYDVTNTSYPVYNARILSVSTGTDTEMGYGSGNTFQLITPVPGTGSTEPYSYVSLLCVYLHRLFTNPDASMRIQVGQTIEEFMVKLVRNTQTHDPKMIIGLGRADLMSKTCLLRI